MKKKRSKRKLKKGIKVGIFIFVILIFLAGGFIMRERLFPLAVSFRGLNIEINSKTMLYDLIDKDDGIKVLTENYEIDTSKLGKQEVSIKIEKNGKDEEISFDINVVDTEKPVIDGKDEVSVTVGDEVDLLKDVTATDNSNEEIKVSIIGEYDIDKVRKYSLEYSASDSSGNVCSKKFVLKVVSLDAAPVSYTEYKNVEDGNYSTDNGHTLNIKDGVAYVDGYVIVNKTYALPSNYKPVNPYTGSVTSDRCVDCIDKKTMEAFKDMEADARTLGLNIYISSGYRSYNYQKNLFNNYKARDGQAAADKYSARAGHSEHQSGYCFDLNTIDDSFANTDEGRWIDSNAYLYGFIIRYPKGKEDKTGYQYESWHLRYVGKELAEKLYNNGDWITMEEYFGLTSRYN